MSPEQARGRLVDKRTDVWAFGAVLYQMLAGRPAFAADDVSDTLARILQQEPDWAALPADVPPAVKTVLRRCLQKDRKQRLRDIGDVTLALEDAVHSAVPEETPLRSSRRGGRLAAGLASVFGVALARVAFIHFSETLPLRNRRFHGPDVSRRRDRPFDSHRQPINPGPTPLI